MANSTFFGIQLVCDLPVGDPRRERLAGVVQALRLGAASDTAWRDGEPALLDAVACATRGTWDLFRGRSQPQAEWTDWSTGCADMAGWAPEDFGLAGRFLLVTGIVLTRRGTLVDDCLGTACDVRESHWHRRSTYQTLMRTFVRLDRRQTDASALYLSPHPLPDGRSALISGFSAAALADDGFAYLRDLDG